MSDIKETDESTVTIVDTASELGEEPTVLPPSDQLNTGLMVQGTSAGDLEGQFCSLCEHQIDPGRRGSPRCNNGCMCTSNGCTIKVEWPQQDTNVASDAPKPESTDVPVTDSAGQ